MKKLIFMLILCMCVIQACTSQNLEKINDSGMKLYNKNKYAQAFEIFEQVKMQTEKEFGKESADYALSCTGLASSYFAQGLYAKAQPLFIEAKNIQEKKLGKEHPDYAASCNNLANLYNPQGFTTKADALFKKAKDSKAMANEKNKP